jgi:NodT family efflux transporter outer membrane factor (OMF) lipoprotein
MTAPVLMMVRFFLAILALIGCTVGPDYQAPRLTIPENWSEQRLSANIGKPQPEQWWRAFHDPVLDRLMSDAISASLDYQQALLRLRDARIQRSATLAAGLPALSARGNLSRRFNNTSAGSQTGGSAVGGGFGVGPQHINIFQLGFDAHWELDFFGGVRRAVEAADATVDSELENSRDVLVTVLAEVARNYIELRANQQLLALANETVLLQQAIHDLTQVRQQAGLASQLEVAQARALAAETEAQVPVYETLIKNNAHQISLLLGREPGALALRLNQPGAVPGLSTPPIIELPSELLLRRPDIRRAERQMAIANAAVGVATAELYPKINLAAFLGLQNMKISDITPVGKSWSAASSLSLPIFNWGKLNAQIKSKKNHYQQSLLSYQATVLNAFKEVEDALTAYSREQARKKPLVLALEAKRLALQLANERYQKGLTSFLPVLDAQQALTEAQSRLIESEAKLARDAVALYKALGGGWRS